MATVQVAVVAPVGGIAASGVQFEEKPRTRVELPGVAVAVSVTGELSTKSAVHVAPAPQLIPIGLLTIVPLPLPTGYTVKDGSVGVLEFGCTVKLDVATTALPLPNVAFAVMLVMQLPGGRGQLTAVASPDELIVATSVSTDCQITQSVTSLGVGLEAKVPMARN